VTVVFAFLVSLWLCTHFPSAGLKYLSPLGESVTGTIVFLAVLGLWLLAGFRPSALFLAAGFVLVFVLLVFFFFAGAKELLASGFAFAHWGMFQDLLLVLRHTALPVFCAGIVVAAAKSRRRMSSHPEKKTGDVLEQP
jgi:hypothetical protein